MFKRGAMKIYHSLLRGRQKHGGNRKHDVDQEPIFPCKVGKEDERYKVQVKEFSCI